MSSKIQEGDRVRVYGAVNYGDEWFDVDTEGVVVGINKRSMLITLDRIDGDGLATCIVKNKCISKLE